MDADIVITTYNTLAIEYKNRPSVLHDIEWFRVVLDEGLLKSSLLSPLGSVMEFRRREFFDDIPTPHLIRKLMCI